MRASRQHGVITAWQLIDAGVSRATIDCRWPEHRLTVELDSTLMLAELRGLLRTGSP